MNGKAFNRKFASVNINSQGQTVENINRIVADILGRAGCDKCGRVALMRVDFVTDQPAELAQLHVSSFVGEGLTHG